MAHQAITVTKASPNPAAITLAADTTCLHLSGVIAAGLLLEVSPDGTLPYAPLVAMQELGAYATKPGVYNVALKAGWRLRAAGVQPLTGAAGDLAAVVAVE
jgi:hypothetical protein